MSIELHFDDEDWERIERDWTAWWAGELARPMVMLQSVQRFAPARELSEEFLLERPIDAVLDYYQEQLEAMYYYGDAFPKVWPNFGPGIVAGFLGADVHCDPDGQTVWFDHAPLEPQDLLGTGILLPLEHQQHAQRTARLEAGVGVAHLIERTNHHRRTGEQHQRQGDLPDHECVAQSQATGRCGRGAALPQRTGRLLLRRA